MQFGFAKLILIKCAKHIWTFNSPFSIFHSPLKKGYRNDTPFDYRLPLFL
ncbi:hypothetical protein ELI_4100 [Eubacterium callanderi]|uniref:Uncharacterized protein n=1 Tax=Eubacterium callanderi TaxID=53442 RepID=E3GH87_9FIRM|nr:hypothetical protein ELI_4100 [Eubacterium callanderi]